MINACTVFFSPPFFIKQGSCNQGSCPSGYRLRSTRRRGRRWSCRRGRHRGHRTRHQPGRSGRFRYDKGCTPQQLAVLAQLDVFFVDDRLKLVHRSIQQRRASSRDVSLRTLDWLVTNYSKKNLVRVVSLDGVPRDLHNAYRETLDFYGRPLFDPFRRGTRVHFTWGKDTLDTTCGQLNFFRFMIYCGVPRVRPEAPRSTLRMT